MMLLLLADTPCMCYNDQVLGTWQLNITEFNISPDNDQTKCPDTILPTTQARITLRSPNVAIDEDTGYVGTWSMLYVQTIEIKLGGFNYFFQLNYVENYNGTDQVHSLCNESLPSYAFVHKEGLTRGKFACF